MQTVIYIYFTDFVIHGKTVIIPIPFQFHFIKRNIFIIELRNISIYIQQVLITVDTSVDIGIIKSPDIFCKTDPDRDPPGAW